MAVIKLQSTKIASRLLSYCEKRAEERSGVDCDPSYAKDQFKATRELWGKADGVQAHHVIQSFSPEDPVTPQEANEIGRQLAERIAPGHECAVYTHTDKAHIHNHIVINAVNYETGKKYHSDRKQLYNIRERSNELCQEKGLEVVKDQQQAPERFSMAEYKAVDRGEPLWKDELRSAIEEAKQQTLSLKEMQAYLKQNYHIEMKIQNKNVSFLHPEKQRFCRGNTLGADYTKGAIEHEYERKREIILTQDRGSAAKLGFNEHVFRTNQTDRGEDERLSHGTIQRNEEIHADRNGIRESAEGQERSGQTEQQHTIRTRRSIEKPPGRSQQTSARADQDPQNGIRENEQRTWSASRENPSTPSRPTGIRTEFQARKQTNPERKIDGGRFENSGDRGTDIGGMGNANPAPSVSGAGLLHDVMKSVEQAARQMEGEKQAERARNQQQHKRKQQQSRDDWER